MQIIPRRNNYGQIYERMQCDNIYIYIYKYCSCVVPGVVYVKCSRMKSMFSTSRRQANKCVRAENDPKGKMRIIPRRNNYGQIHGRMQCEIYIYIYVCVCKYKYKMFVVPEVVCKMQARVKIVVNKSAASKLTRGSGERPKRKMRIIPRRNNYGQIHGRM